MFSYCQQLHLMKYFKNETQDGKLTESKLLHQKLLKHPKSYAVKLNTYGSHQKLKSTLKSEFNPNKKYGYQTHRNVVVVIIGSMINLCFHCGTLRFPFA